MSNIPFIIRKGRRARNGAFVYGTIEQVHYGPDKDDPVMVSFRYDDGVAVEVKASELHPPRVQVVCGCCRSVNVMRDAWAEWNVEVQKWDLGNVFDNGFCNDCDGESRLEMVEVDQDGKPVDPDEKIAGEDEGEA